MGHPHNSIQPALAAASEASRWSARVPHHPIACCGPLWFYDDDRFACEHVTVPPDDPRTKAALNLTVAVLLLELAAGEA
jgi:hypothetical protein